MKLLIRTFTRIQCLVFVSLVLVSLLTYLKKNYPVRDLALAKTLSKFQRRSRETEKITYNKLCFAFEVYLPDKKYSLVCIPESYDIFVALTVECWKESFIVPRGILNLTPPLLRYPVAKRISQVKELRTRQIFPWTEENGGNIIAM